MGTNYYAVFDDQDNHWEGVHLTKTSGGWRPSIQLHGIPMGCECECEKHWYRNIDEFRAFISRDDVRILDEYGEEWSVGEFMEKLEKFNENQREPTGHDYRQFVEFDGWIFHGGDWS